MNIMTNPTNSNKTEEIVAKLHSLDSAKAFNSKIDKLKRPKVVAIVYDGLCTFEYAICAEIFGLLRPEMGENWYEFESIAIENGKLSANGGLSFEAKTDFDAIKNADLILIPGWKSPEAKISRDFEISLLKAYSNGAVLASICSGAFVLAQTGLLNSKTCATHWRYAKKMHELHPLVKVDDKVLFVENDRIYTSAGSAAGIDLMLHIIERDFGIKKANLIAKRLVFPLRRSGGQAQFIDRPLAHNENNFLSKLSDEIQQKLDENWTIERMANFCAMSTRTFIRRFKDIHNQSPIDWLIDLRLEGAKEALQSTNIDFETIAFKVGFGTADTMRHHFRKRLLLSPRDYRSKFV